MKKYIPAAAQIKELKRIIASLQDELQELRTENVMLRLKMQALEEKQK